MMRNSLPRFISFSSGRASSVSSGSWRIFSRILYLDGAMMSSCSRIRPSSIAQRQTHSVTGKPAFALQAGYHSKLFLPISLYGMQSRPSSLPQMATAKAKGSCVNHYTPRYLQSSCSEAEWPFLVFPCCPCIQPW